MDADRPLSDPAGNRTRVWTVFHLNLMFSSIEEEARPQVIERCYWPLLRAAESCRFPIGIEMTGYTLATINKLDPAWVAKLRELISTGLVEPIASGEAQLIGPLVPAAVNAANLRLGNQSYENLLGQTPKLVLVNEQCFSRSMIDHYIEAGYSGFITDWDNVYLANPDWDPALRYVPQAACSSSGRTLPVLWSLTVAFQKFQRLAHGADDRAGYWQWLNREIERGVPALNLYCNDAEIFDFRPGRFETEPKQGNGSEWTIIESLFADLRRDKRIACHLPSDILAGFPPAAERPLTLSTAAIPLPTKKQEKYNVLRWAATGRDDIGINSRCLALAHRLRDSLSASDEDWRELCYLYSSDFRTHITDQRWAAYRKRLGNFERRWNHGGTARVGIRRPNEKFDIRLEPRADGLMLIETKTMGVEFNAKRGLALHRLWTADQPHQWLFGTIPFGYYDDIRLGADFYSGHVVLQQPGKAQITDLSPVEAWLREEADWLSVYAKAETSLGPVEKEWRLHRNAPRLDLLYHFDWKGLPLGVLRLGHITVNPDFFEPDALWYETHNGGGRPERFRLNGTDFDHGRPVSHIVSASTALGMTEDVLTFGDDKHSVTVSAERKQSAVVPMIVWRHLRQGFFFRIAFSAAEIDDTARDGDAARQETWPHSISFSLVLGNA